MDKLIVKGLGRQIDGEYEFDFAGMLAVGGPDSLTNREGHRIKLMSGVRAGELQDALIAGDNDVLVAFAAIILARAGKTVNEEVLWDSPMGSGVAFELEDRQEADEEDPPGLPAKTPDTIPSPSGGPSSKPTLVHPAKDPSPTGHPDSETSAVSAHAT